MPSLAHIERRIARPASHAPSHVEPRAPNAGRRAARRLIHLASHAVHRIDSRGEDVNSTFFVCPMVGDPPDFVQLRLGVDRPPRAVYD